METVQSATPGAPDVPAPLSVKAAWLDRVMGIKVTGFAAAPPVPSPALTGRLKALVGRVNTIPGAKRHTDELRAAIEAVKACAADAEEQVGRIEALIASMERGANAAAEIAEASTGVNASVVAFAKLRLRWNAVQASRLVAIDRMKRLAYEVLDAEFADDPGLDEARATVDEIDGWIPQPDRALADALDALADATDELARARARNQALKAISAYRQAIDADPILLELQDTEYGSYQIYDEIAGSLRALESALAA